MNLDTTARAGKRRPALGLLVKAGVVPALLLGTPPSHAQELPEALELPAAIAEQILTETGLDAATALLNTCVTGLNSGQQFQEDCNAIFGAQDPLAAANALNQVAADQVVAQNAAASRQLQTNLGVVGGRLLQLRLAARAAEADDAVTLAHASALGRATGGGASADEAFGKLGAFFNARYRQGDEDRSEFQNGYDFDGWGGTAGIDYRFTDDTVAGVAASFMRDDVDYDDGRGEMTTDVWGLMAYGTRYWDGGLFVEGMAGYSWSDYDLERRLSYSVGSQNVSQIADSSTDAEMLTLSVGGGYQLYQGALSLTPTLRLDYIRNEVDGFSESMSDPNAAGGGMAIGIDSTTYESLTSRLGVQVARSFSHAGGVVVPSARIDWVHEFDNDQQRVDGRFLGDVTAGTPFFVLTNNPDRNYFDLELTISGQFAGGKSAFLSYSTLLGFEDVSYHAINAGVRLEF